MGFYANNADIKEFTHIWNYTTNRVKQGAKKNNIDLSKVEIVGKIEERASKHGTY